MKASKAGIEINKAELGALLFFAGKADSAVVKFRVDGRSHLVVSASDGKRAVECDADAGDAEKGEWLVTAGYLELLRRGVNKGRTEILLRVTAKGLKDALLRGAISRDAQQEIVDKTNGTSTQVSMESLHKLVKEVSFTGSWFAIIPKQVNKVLDVVSKAADNHPVTIYPPKESTGLVAFECDAEAGRWRGMFQPASVTNPGEKEEPPEADDDDGKPELPLMGSKRGGRGYPKNPSGVGAGVTSVPGKPDVVHEAKSTRHKPDDAGDDSGIVDDDYAKPPGKKKAAKKAPKGK